MIASKHTQSLTDFRLKASETLERLNRTGEAEILTVNGQAKAVLVAPAIFDELTREAELSRDVTVMQQAIHELDRGLGEDAERFFQQVRTRLKTGRKPKSSKGKRGQ